MPQGNVICILLLNICRKKVYFLLFHGKYLLEIPCIPGDHKKRAKYRFASKTLMRILPDNLKTEVENLINQKTMTLDLYEILGQCTWGQGTKGV